MKLVGIGHSHITCIKRAAVLARKELGRSGIEMQIISLRDDPRFAVFRRPDKAGGFQAGMGFIDALQQEIEGADLLFSCVAGNAHNLLGLVNHPRPYDFVLENNPDLPLHPEYEVVPSRIVKQAMLRQGDIGPAFWLLKTIKQTAGIPFVHCESPPPIPSADHINTYPGIFKEIIAQNGIAPALFRYKLWRVQSLLFKAECDAAELDFLPVPAGMIDESGFLIKDAWNPDPSHANYLYGQAVIEQLVRLKDPSFTFPKSLS